MTKNEPSLPLPRLSIERYRGLEGLEFEGFGQINLIVGANGCGKTTVLKYISSERDLIPKERYWESIYLDLFSLAYRGVPKYWIQSAQEASDILELLSIVNPMITWLSEKWTVTHRGVCVPIDSLGVGVAWLHEVAIAIARAENGVLLVDDIELGIHWDIFGKVFPWLVQWAKKYNVQIFATTHNIYVVDALIDATESDSDLVLYRLESRDSKAQIIRHPRSRLEGLREMDLCVLS